MRPMNEKEKQTDKEHYNSQSIPFAYTFFMDLQIPKNPNSAHLRCVNA